MVKNPPANAGDIRDTGLNPGYGRFPGGGHGNPLQFSCLENPMDGGAWWATVHRVTKSWTQLKRLITHTHTQYVSYGHSGHLSGPQLTLSRILRGRRVRGSINKNFLNTTP